MRGKHKYPLSRVIAVDVDETLIFGGKVNHKVVAAIKEFKSKGFEVIVWSSRGTEHAKGAVVFAGLLQDVDVITSKPGVIIDDRGWDWIRFTKVIKPRQLV